MITALETVTDPARAQRLLLHPLRVRILHEAREPLSATDIGRRLGEGRQKVNYHVRELERAGFLEPAGTARRGNLTERRVVATAHAYVLLPEVLGPLAADVGEAAAQGDAMSAGYLMALTARVQSELGRAWAAARGAGKRLPTLSFEASVRLDPARRAAFAEALRTAVGEVIARHSLPVEETAAGGGTRFRLVLGVYPGPEEVPE